MAMDTPATIAVLGAGPMGIETALYARYLGYQVLLVERDKVAANVLRWGHLRMFSPFADLHTTLGIAALRAQDPSYMAPPVDTQLTGRQWVEQYLRPLANSDLLADHIVCGATVQGIGRRHFLKSECTPPSSRDDDGFRILLEQRDGSQAMETADIVIDTTGVYNQPNWCGAGGIPARGEQLLKSRIVYTIPDLLGSERAEYEARHVLVIGSGLSAATTLVALVKMMDQVPQTRVTWVTRRNASGPQTGPIRLTSFADLPQHRQLAETANRCVQKGRSSLIHLPGVSIEAFEFDAEEGKFLVWFDAEDSPRVFDRVIANVGYRGNAALYEELHVRASERTDGPLNIGDPLDKNHENAPPPTAAERANALITTEPHFYVLGAKSHGRDSSFRMSRGYEQIRDLFSIIGDRAELDLYATAQS